MRISDWSSDVCSSDLSPSRSIIVSKLAVLLPSRVSSSASPIVPLAISMIRPPVEMSAGLLNGGRSLSAERDETPARPGRSEEHTSELQSLMRISYAVFCLKKKNNKKTNYKRDKK